jgi:putative hemolysin
MEWSSPIYAEERLRDHARLRDQMAPTEFHAFPRLPLPLDRLNGGLEVDAPPLIKGYLKLGAKICSAPAWDPDFNTADLLTMLRLSEINPRYAKHFFGL